MNRSFRLLFALIFIVTLPSCSKLKSLFGGGESSPMAESAQDQNPAPVPATDTAAKSTEGKCANGGPPQVLTGSCTGTWRVPSGKSTCTYEWGPMVKCPAGTTAVGYNSVCYGITEKPWPEGKNITPETCAKQFGATPANPAYTLKCCGG